MPTKKTRCLTRGCDGHGGALPGEGRRSRRVGPSASPWCGGSSSAPSRCTGRPVACGSSILQSKRGAWGSPAAPGVVHRPGTRHRARQVRLRAVRLGGRAAHPRRDRAAAGGSGCSRAPGPHPSPRVSTPVRRPPRPYPAAWRDRGAAVGHGRRSGAPAPLSGSWSSPRTIQWCRRTWRSSARRPGPGSRTRRWPPPPW